MSQQPPSDQQPIDTPPGDQRGQVRRMLSVGIIVALVALAGVLASCGLLTGCSPAPRSTAQANATATAQAQTNATAIASINATATAQARTNATATVGIPTHTAHPNATATSIPTPYVVSSSKVSDLEIRTTYPAEMELHHAYPIEMSLTPKSRVSSVSALLATYALISASNPTTNVASPTPVGTPNTTIKNAFGKGYKPFATATFYAGTFSVQPSMPQEQSLEQSEVSWKWNVTPQETGVQVMSGEIRIGWKSINQSSAVAFSFIVGNPQIVVRVNGPFDWSPVITTALATILGSGTLALLTWLGTLLWKRISKRGENKKENEATKTPNEPPSNNVTTQQRVPPPRHRRRRKRKVT